MSTAIEAAASRPPLLASLSTGDRAKRGALLAFIAAAHLLLLLWLVNAPANRISVEHRPNSVSLISISDGVRAVSPPATPKTVSAKLPPPPLVVLPSIKPHLVEMTSAPAVAASASAAGDPGGCAVAAQAIEAIVNDPRAMAELAALPPGYRTSADAVLLWNGQWVTTDSASVAPPIAPELRHVVEQVVAGTGSECRDAAIGGPQFLAIPEAGRTTTLVVGSGVWRWSDLLPECDAANRNSCVKVTANAVIDQLL